MQEKDIITRLSVLKAIQPSENWVCESRRKVLSQTPVSYETHKVKLYNIFDKYATLVFNLRSLAPNKLAFSLLSAVFVLFMGIFTVSAAKSSMPGDPLYLMKIANENLVLAIVPEAEKSKVEIEQAGNRLEELARISQKMSDVEQQQKVEQLVTSFEKKINNVNQHLTKVSNSGEKERIAAAKVINIQSEKYGEALTRVKENLPATVKEKVSEQVAKAIVSTEKINLNSLMVIAETEKDAEIMAKVKAKIDKAEQSVKMLEGKSSTLKSSETAGKADDARAETGDLKNTTQDLTTNKRSEGNNSKILPNGSNSSTEDSDTPAANDSKAMKSGTVLPEEAKKEIEKAKENLENNNLLDALKGVVAAEAITEKAKLEFEVMPVPVDAGKDATVDGNDLAGSLDEENGGDDINTGGGAEL